jgi:hypothetical protein
MGQVSTAAVAKSESRPLQRGDRVELRAPTEILALLDESGTQDGLPFMPEMLSFFGRELTVAARVERACDTIESSGVRRMPNAVVLESVRCDGTGHGSCQAACLIYWKEDWLRRVGEGGGATDRPHGDALDRLAALAASSARRPTAPTENVRYRCQATEFIESTVPLRRWDARSFLREMSSRNVSVPRFALIMSRAIFDEIRIRLGMRDPKPFKKPGSTKPGAPASTLEPGAVVRIQPKERVADTLDESSKLRGLWFDREMLHYCGKTTVVKDRVEHFIDERTGEMIDLASDAYILEGVICRSCVSDGRWFCPRAIYSWWRQAWLEVPGDGDPDVGVT